MTIVNYCLHDIISVA